MMNEPMRRETPFPRTRGDFEETSDPRVRLRTGISVLVHVETVLDGQRARVGKHRVLALTGNLYLPELRAEIAFGSLNAYGNGSEPTEEHWATAVIIPRQLSMTIPLQYLALPAREESDVWALSPAPDHHAPWMEHYAGRLDGEPLTFDRYVPVDATLDVTFTAEQLQNDGGAKVDFDGELLFERSMHMRFLFSDPEQSTAPPSEPGSDEAVLIVAGSRVPIPRQTVSRLAGCSPCMTVRVIEADGRVVCVEQPLTGPARSAA